MKFIPAYKMVLSGLSERSAGNGAYKRTVWHAQLTEDYKAGRLNRKAGDFLCKKLTRTTFDVHTADEAAIGRGVKVNCKACIEMIAKS